MAEQLTIRSFKLSSVFLEDYKGKQPQWGYNGLGFVVYKRTYARTKDDGNLEEFWETCQRVVEGTYDIQKKHCKSLKLPWDERKAQRSAQEMYKRMWEFKFLPPGRGLWMMGSPAIERLGAASLNNCGFSSTKDLSIDFAEPFVWLMDMLMLGVGIGFDTKGENTVKLQKPQVQGNYVVEDSREGWVSLLRTVLNSYVKKSFMPATVDYSLVRLEGAPIKGFGGVASGPAPLIELIDSIKAILDPLVGLPITATAIVDVCNLIGRCVVAGNVRRSAQIAFGNMTDEEFLNLKNPEINQEALMHHRWSSNNSVFAEVGSDYTRTAELTAKNGEPGYQWLENARAYGRMKDPADYADSKVMGANPCVEQSLEDRELCCVSGETRILTKNGYPKISDVVGTPVTVWNGTEWSEVTPFLAAKNKELYRVTLSDGSFLDATGDHGWSARSTTAQKFQRVDTVDLRPGMRLADCEAPKTDEGIDAPNAYVAGWVVGDGFVDGEKVMALVQEPEYAVLPMLEGVVYKSQKPDGYSAEFSRVNVSSRISLDFGKALRDSDTGLPPEIFTWNDKSLASFFGAWVDTDGTVRNQANTDNYVICSISEKKLRDSQMLLRRLGVNHATLHKWNEAGEETNKGIRTKALWCLYIPSYEAENITPFLKTAVSFGSRNRTNHAHPSGATIDRAVKQHVVSIVKLEGLHDTFCFTEPKRHMGVFGNCLTYQCLVETFPGRHDTYEDYKKTLKYAYLYAKTVTLVPTHDARTNTVLMRNRRIGCSMSGITQAMQKFGRRAFLSTFCDEGYTYLRSLDKVYSDWLCVRTSIKVTSVKPSGTVSLLAGVTPGIHFPHAEYYIRRVRLQENSPLVETLTKAGYPVEKDSYSPNTLVATFPVHEQHFDRSKDDLSMWEQLELAAQMQHWWADNQVSVTVTFRKDEAKDIKYALELYETRLKGVSFLPVSEHGYAQAPYETISEEKYNALMSAITPLSTDSLVHEETSRFCDGDSCTI